MGEGFGSNTITVGLGGLGGISGSGFGRTAPNGASEEILHVLLIYIISIVQSVLLCRKLVGFDLAVPPQL